MGDPTTMRGVRDIVEGALISEATRDLRMSGFSIGEVERAVCLRCREIDRDAMGYANSGSAAQGARLMIRSGNRNVDAGHICGSCMSSKEGQADG